MCGGSARQFLCRADPPFASGPGDGICVGDHIGQRSPTPAYASGTVGVIILEPGGGLVNTVVYQATIRSICFRPRGAMTFGEPDPEFQFVFRARIQ